MSKTLRIDVWSDIACPWCYVGKRRLEAALSQFEHRDAVEVVWRSFELDPAAPKVQPGPADYAGRLARKYGTTVAKADEMIRSMTATAARDGLSMRFDRAQPGNTFDAHRLLHLAHARGLQDAAKERFFRAYMTDGEAIGDAETLTRLAVDAGLDREEVVAVLAGDAWADAVRADEAEARENNIRGVPFFVFDGRYAVSGAHPAESLAKVLAQAWSERPADVDEGALCGPEGCA
jgi:predicted DsbA family dithiol-disulfide isomerase